MTPKKKTFRDYFDKLKFKYKLILLNEKTLEKVFNFRISQLSAFVYGFLFLILAFVLLSLLIIFTPIKYYLPGFSDYSLRGELIESANRIDSLSNKLTLQSLQLQTAKNIISGTIPMDSIPKQKEISLEEYQKLASKKSDREKQFIENFKTKFSETTQAIYGEDSFSENMFVLPLSGNACIVKDEHKGDIMTSNSSLVCATSKGKVILTNLSIKDSYTIVIQHSGDVISVYKNLRSIFKNVGESVSQGEVIGEINLQGDNPYLIFETWKKGEKIPIDKILTIK